MREASSPRREAWSAHGRLAEWRQSEDQQAGADDASGRVRLPRIGKETGSQRPARAKALRQRERRNPAMHESQWQQPEPVPMGGREVEGLLQAGQGRGTRDEGQGDDRTIQGWRSRMKKKKESILLCYNLHWGVVSGAFGVGPMTPSPRRSSSRAAFPGAASSSARPLPEAPLSSFSPCTQGC